jgi:hypothetical protein
LEESLNVPIVVKTLMTGGDLHFLVDPSVTVLELKRIGVLASLILQFFL